MAGKIFRCFSRGGNGKSNNYQKAVDKPEKNRSKVAREAPSKVSYYQLYRYATCCDRLMILLGCVLMVITGIASPLMKISFGNIMAAFVNFAIASRNESMTIEEFEIAKETLHTSVNRYALICTILGVFTVAFSYLATVLFYYTSHKQIFKIRTKYFESILNQDIAWYDRHSTGDFIIRITEDLIKIQDGIGDKVSVVVFNMSIFTSGIIMGLYLGWKLALVCLISTPLFIFAISISTLVTKRFTKTESASYGAAGSVAEEVFTAIKTVVAFEGQEKEQQRYEKHLMNAKRNNIKKSTFVACGSGLMWFNIYATICLTFWYGFNLIIQDRHVPVEEMVYTPATMIAVFFTMSSSNWNFVQCFAYFDVFAAAQAAAYKIFSTIDNAPHINASKNNGIIPEKIEGNLSFSNVFFKYPARKDVTVLRGLNLKINAGETVALVGSSGCGKSTITQLIQRFYDPTSGSVSLDDNDISVLDLTWLRSHIGVVGQEPVLFATTISENIRYGHRCASQDDIEQAAKKANAHSFIRALPDGYHTIVGERGAQLSGGQKQRIAIARALVKSPSILLLDEATSALDTKSEAVVQAAIDSASKECTTIIIAHRLSTVKEADRIIVFSEGVVVEEGTHKRLMKTKGHYYKLVMRQAAAYEIMSDNENENECELDDKELSMQSRRDSIFYKNAHLQTSTNMDLLGRDSGIVEDSYFKSVWNIMKMNKPESLYIAIACFASLITGGALPVYAVFLGDLIGILSSADDNQVLSTTNRVCVYFLILGVVSGIAAFIANLLYSVAGEKLTFRVRSLLFKSMLHQEIGWFDEKENGVGALCSRLSTDAAYVQGASGQPIGTLVNTASSLTIAIILALIFEYRVALMTMCFTPCIFISIYVEQRIMNRAAARNNQLFEESSKLAVEAISNIKTVASLGCEDMFRDMYTSKLQEHFDKTKHGGHFQGVAFGMARAMKFFSYGISFYYGGILILNEDVDYTLVFKSSESLISSAWSIGQVLAFASNFQKGVIASKKIMELLNRTPKIPHASDQNINFEWSNGNISYDKVGFTYPTRANVRVLKELDLKMFQGKTVALVGTSGCGKSTIVQLLQRFYDPNLGEVALDDLSVRNMSIGSLRSNFGTVSQEPVLFNRTIADNISYGNNKREVDIFEVIQAAKSANIHNFIVSLPKGYETSVGAKGTRLSGGQKQRIAIARALIRNPKVLLLDEATSALDVESEKVVQEALDNARKDRTCIIIAHRLSTVQNADVICVISKGKVQEMGSHSELIQKRGLYYKLQKL